MADDEGEYESLLCYATRELQCHVPGAIPRDLYDNERELLKILLTVVTEPVNDAAADTVEKFLQMETKKVDNIVDVLSLYPFVKITKGVNTTELCIWRGDITKLKVDGIVNAANSALLGCFKVNHACIGMANLELYRNSIT